MNDAEQVWDALNKVYKPKSHRDQIIDDLSAKMAADLATEMDEKILLELLREFKNEKDKNGV